MFTPIETQNISPENQLLRVLKFLTNFWREFSFPISIFYLSVHYLAVNSVFPKNVPHRCTNYYWLISQDQLLFWIWTDFPSSQHAENPLPFPSPVCYGPHRTNHVVLVSSLAVFFFSALRASFRKASLSDNVALRATIVGLLSCGYNFSRRVTR